MKGNCSEEHLSTAASIVLSVWLSLSGLAAVTGNVVVLWLFHKHESLRTISNRFLASLSVADAFVGLGLRQSLFLHQRSTHSFTTSEIATFAEPFAAPSIGCPVFTNKMHHTLEHNQSETG